VRLRRRWIAPSAIGVAVAVGLAVSVLLASNGPAQTSTALGTATGNSAAAPSAPAVAPLVLPPRSTSSASTSSTGTTADLWHSWQPPADLPAHGTTGTVTIPAFVSGFAARDAQVYLPPAALVAHAPALPFVLMMMGQPGSPDAGPISTVLDQFAAAHNGLAPIVVVADQLGNPDVDSLCLDTPERGNVETYIEQDVVNWARAHLSIEENRGAWTIAGFSNGGQCAISLASKYPAVWGNVISASGSQYAGIETEAGVLAEVFNGNQDAFDAIKPATVMAKSAYPDTTAVFTVGADDTEMRNNLKDLSDDARAAGMHTNYFEVPNQGHTTGALIGGLTHAFGILYPRLGLATPTG